MEVLCSGRPILLWAVSLFFVSSAHAADGYVGVYGDSLGVTPCATIPQSTGATLYVIARTDGGTAGGITGAEFRIEVTNPSGWLLSYTPPGAASVTLGNPLDTDPDPDAGGGVNVAFPTCQTPTGSGQVRLGTISVYNLSGSATSLLVKRHSQPTSTGFTCPLFVKCDGPLYTKLCMITAPPDSCTLDAQKGRVMAADDETIFVASLNAGGGGSDELPRDPDREVWALFTPGTIQLPAGAASATIANTTIASQAVAVVLEAYDIQGVAKGFPDFEPEDAYAVGRTGKPVRLQDLSEIYRFLLAEGESVTDLAVELGEIIEHVVYAEPGITGTSFSCPPNDT
jgi:hypothetical protein